MSEKTDSYIPFFGRDFLAATMGWTAEERGHYLVLLVTQWEQGAISADPSRLELASPGLAKCWEVLGPKFPLCDDGQRRNRRLEEHRAKADELKAARSAAGISGNRKRWGEIANGSQSDRKAIANGIANGIAKRSPPSPSPSPSPTPSPTPTPTPRVKQPSVVATTETPKRRLRSSPSDSIGWTPAAGWEGITDDDRAAWRTAYPACDLAGEFARMTEWLRSNPAKARKSRWRAFVTKWLTRSQDNGGGQASKRPGSGPGPMSLDEKLAIDRREALTRKTWRTPPDGCPDDLAGRFFNQMLSPLEFDQNRAEALRIHRQRLQEAATRHSGVGAACPAVQTTNARPGANAEPGGDDDEAGIEYEPDPVRDGWIGSDGRP